MPLVQRTSKQGNFFKNDTEPSNWGDSDLWADTDDSPRSLWINNAGTALQLGAAGIGDNDLTSGSAPTGTGITVQANASNVVNQTSTVTPTKATNKVILSGSGAFGDSSSYTATLALRQSTTVLASTTKASTNVIACISLTHVVSDVSIAGVDYNCLASGSTTNIGLLTFQVIE